MNRSKPCIFLLLLMATACTRQNEQTHPGAFAPKVVEAKGYVVPKDSMAEPEVVTVGKPKVVKVGIPRVVPANTNIHRVGKLRVVKAGAPQVCTPGKDTFLLPITVPAIDRPFVAGIPEIVLAKDPSFKELNPQNFSSLGKQQGLKHGKITCMLQDKRGNLWFGTNGGVSKYDGRSFTHYTEKEGLSNNAVLSILEDKNGNLWFGTYGSGVSRLSRDGKRFTHFTKKEGLSNNVVSSILEDKYGNLWFGTNGGVSQLSLDRKNFTHYTTKVGLGNDVVDWIAEDRSGNLWFGSYDKGVSKYDGKSFTHYSKKEGLCNNNVRCMVEDKSGNLWFGTNGGGVSRLSRDGKSFTYFTGKEGLSNNRVTSVLEDKTGNLWFGTNGGGVSMLSRDGKRVTRFTEKEGLSNNNVNCILEDKNGTLWVGTGVGVSKYNGKIFTHYSDKEGLNNIGKNNRIVNCILEDKSGNCWFGTYGGGASRLSQDGRSFTYFTVKEGLVNNDVESIIEDKNGNFWFGTWGGVSRLSRDGKSFTNYTSKEGLSSNIIYCITEDKNGNLWFGTEGGGVSRLSSDGKSFTHYTIKEGLSNNIVWSMMADQSGNLWFGTYGGGVTRINRDGKIVTHFTAKEGLGNNSVEFILEDKSGNLWFGTYGGGLSRLNKDGKSFTHYTEKEGLVNNVVLNGLEDRKGNLWFGTRFGISKLPIDIAGEGHVFFKNYTYEDGFLGIGVSRGAICEDSKGTIWFGTNDRLTAYHPEGDMTDTIAPVIQLTNLELFNEDIPWRGLEKKNDTTIILGNGVKVGDFHFDSVSDWYFLPENLSLAYNNNFLTFRYIGITQNQPKKVKYQYKLEGFDQNWSAITSRNDAPYGNLPHGAYTFKVKAMNSDGYWSKELNYTFSIRPPWYKTAWFRLLTVLLILFSLFMVHHWRTASLRRRQKQLEKTVKEQTAEVVKQKEEIECQNEELETTMEHLKKTQSQLIQSEKMASLGLLTAGIAHEINNPVNFINSGAISLQKDYLDLQQFIQTIKQQFPGSRKLAEEQGIDELLKIIPQTIEDIKTGVSRTSEIVKGLRNFTRMDASELKEADIHEGIDSTLLLLSHKLKDRIRVVKEYDDQIGFIKCYPGPLNQVFMNLLNNTIDAIEQKIKEDLSAGEAPATDSSWYNYRIWIKTKLIDENGRKQVKIAISDNGTGIPDEIRDKLFDPFFTTKEVGKGTGLGLAICHGIIEKHGGSIGFESKVNEGTAFTITLPVS